MRSEGRSPGDFHPLADELEALFAQGPSRAWREAEFDKMAVRVLRHQFDGCRAYRGLCARRGIDRDALASWEASPMVPALAFQHLDLVSVAGEPEAVFRTSGTSTGRARRGRHFVPRLALYRASLLGPFRAHVTAGAEPIRFVSLIPSADALPDSSLSHMVSVASDELATRTHWLVDGAGSLDLEGLRAVADESASRAEPVLLLGTALALLHAMERLEGGALAPLAEGSRIMETGGFKGVRRSVTREVLHARLAAATGVPEERIVNEYGMTELLSQLYEPVLRDGGDGRGAHVSPPWLRVRALDPSSLEPLQEGEQGVLAFFDLANAGSVSHVLTQDVGTIRDGRVHLRGRLAEAEARGCSRAMDELMAVAG